MTSEERLFITGMTDVAIALIQIGGVDDVQEGLEDCMKTAEEFKRTIEKMQLGIIEMGRIKAASEARLAELAGDTTAKPKKIKKKKNTLLHIQ